MVHRRNMHLHMYMKSNTLLMAPGTEGAEDRFPGKFLELLDQSSMGDKDTFACK